MSAFGGLEEIAAGLCGWSAVHEGIGKRVYSHYLSGPRVAIDPIGAGGLAGALEEAGGVEQVLLTNRHHYRAAGELAERFGCPVRCPEPGVHELASDDRLVAGYAWDEQVAAGVVAHEVGAICPDDGALHIAPGDGPGALAIADAVIADEQGLAFVPDSLIDDPERTRTGIRDALTRLLELDFDVLLLAHGPPLPSAAKTTLAGFVERPRSARF